jgi:site-specific recombinase XerD
MTTRQTIDNTQSSFPLLDQYVHYMQAVKERSPLTMKEYRYDLVLFFRFMKRDRGLAEHDIKFNEISISDIDIDFIKDIRSDDLFVFMIFLSRERKASSATRARKAATLKSFFKYLFQKRKLLVDDPSYELESPKVGRRLPKYLNLAESVKLINTAYDSQSVSAKRDYCMITLFLNCGMRLSELRGINISDMKDDTLTVIGKGNKERTIYLNPACLRALAEWIENRKNYKINEPDALFLSSRGDRISHQMIQNLVKKRLFEAGIDTKIYSVHKLRHTAATLMYKYGQVDIRSLQTILGHSSVATTQIYTHVDNEALHEAVNKNPLSDFSPENSTREK